MRLGRVRGEAEGDFCCGFESRVEAFPTELVGVVVGPKVAWKVREDGENVVF